MTDTVESKVRIQASREDVWNVLADIQGIPKWAAVISDAQVEGEPGKGAIRHSTFANGGAIEERFIAWRENRLLRAEVSGSLPTASLVSEWELSGEGKETIVVYRARFETGEGAPAGAVARELGGNAWFLLQALKSYVETGKVLEAPEG